MFFKEQHSNESQWAGTWLYAAFALCIVTAFAYGVFYFKAYVEQQNATAWDSRSAAADALPDQKSAEAKITEYQKKLTDYRIISNNHEITSNVFSLIEERTLPNVWFSSFDMTQSIDELILEGETDNMATVGRQMKIFENSQQYIKSVSMVDSETESSGKVTFTVNLFLDPAVFSSASLPLPQKNPS